MCRGATHFGAVEMGKTQKCLKIIFKNFKFPIFSLIFCSLTWSKYFEATLDIRGNKKSL